MTATTTGAAPRRGPGRPRAAGFDEAAIAAVQSLIDAGEPVTVGRVVALSGVSRAALYRRWTSLTDLVAQALDVGRSVDEGPSSADSVDELVDALVAGAADVRASYPEERLRQRLRLVLDDRELQRRYWRSHVSRRRDGMRAVFAAGIARGELAPGLDVEACCDLVVGVFYYQLVVRGDTLTDPATQARCRAAVRIALAGMRVPTA